MASQQPGLPPAHGVTLVVEAQTSDGNVVSKILLSYYMFFTLRLLVSLKWVRGKVPCLVPAGGELVFSQLLPVVDFLLSSGLDS